ncbi:kinase-like domain-containing protein [Aspergillus tamarii]|uniref:Kinase-like domain-containing protein n=1 Tax=Aspergillus tamarii TaxID=41984 RepID=A0A5N6V3W7_ASPTM|nr:kinase-like domain-containing protein [Aspergillus tamarii]
MLAKKTLTSHSFERNAPQVTKGNPSQFQSNQIQGTIDGVNFAPSSGTNADAKFSLVYLEFNPRDLLVSGYPPSLSDNCDLGPLCAATAPILLHEASAATASSNNETSSVPSVSFGVEGICSPVSLNGEFSPNIKDEMIYQCHPGAPQPLPSLHIRTDLPRTTQLSPSKESDPFMHHSHSSSSLPRRTSSLRGFLERPSSGGGSLSPASLLSSPQLMAMGDITPLPSPIGGVSPWKIPRRNSQSLSRTPSLLSRNGSSLSLRLSDSSQVLGPSECRSRSKQRGMAEMLGADKHSETPSKSRPDGAPKHARNRSLSEYVPPTKAIPIKPRPIAVSGSGVSQGIFSSSSTDSKSNNMHREQHLAIHRGIALPAVRPPTPPRSSRSTSDGDVEPVILSPQSMDGSDEIYSVRSIRSQQPRKYRKLRELGQGTFSQVCLAVRMELQDDMDSGYSSSLQGVNAATQKLVAVKVIEHGPAGGADEERLEVSLKREVEILKSVNHPSLVQLKAFGSDEKRALLVLDYCPGGDLFDVATSGPRPMSPELIRRIFSELVAAVRYLHANFIVHRDIKLENVLVTLPPTAMEEITDWRTYDRAVVTLTDLGLSRRIPQPPESPLLHTRCGSEDYAAPEILMGQPYDGRSTDGWALGVLLYAMMENRLPFDALPGTRGDPAKLRARTPHRIARCEWSWYRYADSDGEWDPQKGKDLEGARECVDGLLKRNTKRKNLDEIASIEWVAKAIDVPGGLKRGDKEVP